MYSWNLLNTIFGQPSNHYCNFNDMPCSQLAPVMYVVSATQSCQLLWKDTFNETGKILLEDDLPETSVYQHENQHYMYRGTIPEFSILLTDNVQLTVEQLEQFLDQELILFSQLFTCLFKFDLKLKELLKVNFDKELQCTYLYKFQPKPKSSYSNLYLKLALQHTSLNKSQREAFAENWAQQRHHVLSAYIGYYQYFKTTYSFEAALYSLNQILLHNLTLDMLPKLIQDFKQQVDNSKYLVWDLKNSIYIEETITKCIYQRYNNSSLLNGKAQNVVLDHLSRNAWRKTRSYQGNGNFCSFVKKVIYNKIHDMWMEINDDRRLSTWIICKAKEDPIYMRAFFILFKKQYPKKEAFSILTTEYLEKEEQFISDVIDAILKNCPPHTIFTEVNFSIDDYPCQDEIEYQLKQLHEQEIFEQLKKYLLLGNESSPLQLDESFFAYLQQCAKLTAEDRLLLKLRFLSGLTQQQTAKALHISSSTVHRRIEGYRNKMGIIERLKKCLERYFNE